MVEIPGTQKYTYLVIVIFIFKCVIVVDKEILNSFFII